MTDLVAGIIVIGLLSAMLLVFMLRLSRSLPPRTSNLLAIMLVALLLANSLLVQDSIALTHLLPVSNLVVVGNWSPLLVAALAGLIWSRVPGTPLRQWAVVGSLVVVCLVNVYRPIVSKRPEMNDRWMRGVCLQTSRASCSPAAAATLLRARGIPTTEQEMALLCLTTDEGTSNHGLWRGLRLKTAGTGNDVYMFNHGRIDDLRGTGPVLLSVELLPGAKVDPRYESTWGWMPGVPHSVVLLGFISQDRVMMGDPAVGREMWTTDDLNILWHGVGARLIASKR